MISAEEQQELLVQTIAGIRSALDEQGAKLIGGHTMEPEAPHHYRQASGCRSPSPLTGAAVHLPGLNRDFEPVMSY